MNKPCGFCKTEKPLSEFNKHGENGYTLWCRDCIEKHRKYNRARRASKVYYVYGLFDPLTSRCHYIGKTKMPAIRLDGHITEARNHSGLNAKKIEWINSLVKIGQKPIMVILEETDEYGVDKLETEWCCKMRDAGAILFNNFGVLRQGNGAVSG